MTTKTPSLHPGRDKGYALDFQTPVRHVVTQLEEARQSGRAPSLDNLTESYTSASGADLSRVKIHELGIRRPEHHVADREARQFLIEKVIEALGSQVLHQPDGTYALAVPLEAVRYAGEPVALFQHDRVRFKDPYNPLTDGSFATNTRTLSRDPNLSELRESMRIGGWLDWHPAIKDERGVVIVGHRRLQIAAELGIEPKIETKYFGAGDDADRVRSLYALLSNLGGKSLTPEDRKRWTKHLYEDENWDPQQIADALKVSVPTIYRDMGEFLTEKRNPQGRPRKTTRKLTDEQQLAIAEKRRAGATFPSLQTEYGISAGLAQSSAEYGRGSYERPTADPNRTPCQCCNGTGYAPD